jgi:predicted ATPase/class 3 adenylate cyclase
MTGPQATTREAAPPSSSRPTGTVTLLFTDIEDSTRLWEENTERMRGALQDHDRIVRAAIVDEGGYVFKTLGDAFCSAFDTAPGALNAALRAQLELVRARGNSTDPIRVRIALHAGMADERRGDYFGPALSRVARLLALGHGGQTLVSETVYDLVRYNLPPRVSLRDLGQHRLKDLQHPTRVFQLVHPELPSEFPALSSLDALPHNLPLQLTSFIGREQVIEEITGLLASSRLLTLTGPGGCGKTRLALQVAAEVLERYRGGVWYVQLASLTDPALVSQTVAQTLGLREHPGRSATDLVLSHLEKRNVLLVLDNCEHVVESCAKLAETVLRSCPEVTILATSRETLRVYGETTWLVPPFLMPTPEELATGDGLDKLAGYEAVRLFVDRAQLVQPSFELTNNNVRSVAHVCHRLDGMPLAIELAAARVKVLPIQQIEERLDDRFRLLTSGGRTVLERHQALSGVLDWSYQLLSEAERIVLRRLSIFVGGWTLEAAEHVVAGDGKDTVKGEILDLLSQLVDKSLVVVEDRGGEARYRLLETVREYCRERLADSGELDTMCRRHRAWFLALAKRTNPELIGKDKAIWLERLEVEHGNFRAALEWSENTPGECEPGLELAGALYRFWLWHGYLSDGIDALEKALRCGGNAPIETQVTALTGLSYLSRVRGDLDRSRSAGTECLSIAREANHKGGIARALTILALAAQDDGNYAESVARNQEALALAREVGDPHTAAVALNNLGETARLQGDFKLAREMYEQVLLEADDIVDDEIAYFNLGQVAIEMGDVDGALKCYREGLRLGTVTHNKWIISYCLMGVGQAYRESQPERAARLFAASDAMRQAVGSVLYAADPSLLDRSVFEVRERLGEEAFAEAWEQGWAMNLEQATAQAFE